LRMFVYPAALNIDGGFPVCINHHFNAFRLESFGEMTDKEFCSSVVLGRYGNKRWRNHSDFHLLQLLVKSMPRLSGNLLNCAVRVSRVELVNVLWDVHCRSHTASGPGKPRLYGKCQSGSG
jgi:hypothetical protein